MPETALPATDLDLISFLKAIPDARMRRGIRIPAWYLLLVAVLGILSRCQSLRDLERFAIPHHGVLTEALGIELRRPPSDSAFATSSARWTWRPSAPRSAIGRSPRSPVAQRISISWCVTARP
ncbi:transposase family protein [Synechococcus sp. UW140]|uniref:transposase family protein n=1 Tax=Synechococcus sp. UW140 TaxID=368503 RepID=UPI0034578EF0